jgi:hypothetical protein
MTVATTSYTWRVQQGETESLRIPVTNNDSPMTVTGWTVDAKVKVNPGGPTLYTFPADAIDVSGANVTVTVAPAVSAAWTFGLGWFRVKIADPNAPVDDPVVYRVLQGYIVVDPD